MRVFKKISLVLGALETAVGKIVENTARKGFVNIAARLVNKRKFKLTADIADFSVFKFFALIFYAS